MIMPQITPENKKKFHYRLSKNPKIDSCSNCAWYCSKNARCTNANINASVLPMYVCDLHVKITKKERVNACSIVKT